MDTDRVWIDQIEGGSFGSVAMNKTVSILSIRTGCAPLPDKPCVKVEEFVYQVDFGPQVRPRFHVVGKDARCRCYLGLGCPAVSVVQEYLDRGGEKAKTLPVGYYPVAPVQCPICKAPVMVDHTLSSRDPRPDKGRGQGWRCVSGGSLHYWQTMMQALKNKFEDNP